MLITWPGIDLHVSHNDMDISLQTDLSTCTVDSVDTINRWDDNSVFDNTYNTCRAPHISQEEDCNFVYQEEQEVTYMIPVPKCGTPKEQSLMPITIMMIDIIGMKKSRVILKVLLYPDSTKTLINKSCIPKGANSKPLHEAKKVTNIAGSMKT